MNHNFNEVEMLCWLAGGLSFQDEGLGEEQPGDAKQRQHQQQALDPKLTGVHVLLTLRAVLLVFLPKDQIVQESSFYNPSIMLKTHLEEDHVDKCDENRRGAALSRQVAVLTLKAAGHKAGPLVEHEEAHVAKHAGHEDDLRHKLAEDIGLVVEVLVIPQGQDDAEEHVNDAEDDGDPPDLTGLSCRWTPIKAARGSMVSLVLRCADHRQIHADLARLAGLATLNALQPTSLDARWPPKGLVREAKARRGRKPLVLMIAITALITFVAYIFVKYRIPAGKFDPNRYIKEVTEGAVDFARADESLCVVFDCPQDRIPLLEEYLESRAQRGDLKYGMHLSDHAVMTCLVVSTDAGQHVHFVDGGDGGYTQAATKLKAKLAT